MARNSVVSQLKTQLSVNYLLNCINITTTFIFDLLLHVWIQKYISILKNGKILFEVKCNSSLTTLKKVTNIINKI